jgi:hypothetical protein
MSQLPFGVDPIRLFGDYMKVTGIPTAAAEQGPDPKLAGKSIVDQPMVDLLRQNHATGGQNHQCR